jgi:4-carboxymuconolactone decarboxylase
MTDDGFERGIEFMKRYRDSAKVDAMIATLEERSPRFARYTVGSTYGEVYPRDGLEPRLRQLVTIAVLAVLGDTANQLKIHTEVGVAMGLTALELVETMIQVAAYAGAQRGSSALAAVVASLHELGLEVP